jgi:hypothetical protein
MNDNEKPIFVKLDSEERDAVWMVLVAAAGWVQASADGESRDLYRKAVDRVLHDFEATGGTEAEVQCIRTILDKR